MINKAIRKLIIATSFCIILIAGCVLPHTEPRPYDLYVIKNQTDFDIEIKGYGKQYLDSGVYTVEKKGISDPFIIKANDEYEYFAKFKEGNYSNIFGIVDSMVIIFGTSRILVQGCEKGRVISCPDPKDRILYYFSSVESINAKIEKKQVKTKFTILVTNEDYERATPL